MATEDDNSLSSISSTESLNRASQLNSSVDTEASPDDEDSSESDFTDTESDISFADDDEERTNHIHTLPNEVLLRLLTYLEPVDEVCLALASTHEYNFILSAHKYKQLSHVVPYNCKLDHLSQKYTMLPALPTVHGGLDFWSILAIFGNDKKKQCADFHCELMRQLEDWMAEADYVPCVNCHWRIYVTPSLAWCRECIREDFEGWAMGMKEKTISEMLMELWRKGRVVVT